MKHHDGVAAVFAAIERFGADARKGLAAPDLARVERATRVAQVATMFIDAIVRRHEIKSLRDKWKRSGKKYKEFRGLVPDYGDEHGAARIDGMWKILHGEDVAGTIRDLHEMIEGLVRDIKGGVRTPEHAALVLFHWMKSVEPQLCDLVPTNISGEGDIAALAALLAFRKPTTLRIRVERVRRTARWIVTTILYATKPAALEFRKSDNRGKVEDRIDRAMRPPK